MVRPAAGEVQGVVVGHELMFKAPDGGPVRVKLRVTWQVNEQAYTDTAFIITARKGAHDRYPIGGVVGVQARLLQQEMDFGAPADEPKGPPSRN